MILKEQGAHCEVIAGEEADLLQVRISGIWRVGNGSPHSREVIGQIESHPGARRISFVVRDLASWDSSLLTFLTGLIDHCSGQEIEVNRGELPRGVQKLLALAGAVPERKGARRAERRDPILSRIGEGAIRWGLGGREALEFTGEAFVATIRLFLGRARFRRSDLILFLQDCGARSLPIVSLISLLVGLILGFVGAVQLVVFGAQLYIAPLVGIAMVRVMGAIMVGVIMAGRTGAAFAAQLGTMQVNEEIDALKTLGVSPMEFLVLPRMLALTIMMPLLCLYADLMGVLGGLIVGVGLLDVGFREYLTKTQETVTLTQLWIGLFHSLVFGILIALTGCLRGIQCGRSSSAVGYAATSAVVTGIVCIVVATAIITYLCNVLGI